MKKRKNILGDALNIIIRYLNTYALQYVYIGYLSERIEIFMKFNDEAGVM